MTKTLVLPIKKQWFDMIASGIKREEYREIKPHYQARFKLYDIDCLKFLNSPLFILLVFFQFAQRIDFIKFTNGYGNNVPSITVELLGIEKGTPKPEWSEGTIEQDLEVFVLKLGRIIQ